MAKAVIAAACYSGLYEEDEGRSTCPMYSPNNSSIYTAVERLHHCYYI